MLNENILQRAKDWGSFSFDEKIIHISRLNDQRRNEVDKRRAAKTRVRTTKTKTTKKKAAKPVKMSKTAQSLLDSLPDNIRKGFL